MKLKPYILILGIALLASSCSHGFYYHPDPAITDKNNTYLRGGVVYAISQQAHTSVIITAIKPAGDQLKLKIGYLNNSATRADAIPESIKVYTLDGKKLTRLRVYSANEYINKLQRKQNFAMAAQAFSDGYNNASAGYSASTTTGSAVSSNGTYVAGSSTTVTYDQSKVAEADYRSRQELQQMAGNFNQYNQNLSAQLIRGNTLLPGQSIEGYVIVNTSKSFDKTIYITVPFGGEEHAFTLIPNK